VVTVATMADQSTEEQQRTIARASRSSDLGSSCKSNAEHASAQFTSLMDSNHGIHGHNSSQADLAQSTVAGAGRADQRSTYPSAEVVRVEAVDGTLGAMEQDSADVESFTRQSFDHVEVLCGKAQNLVLEMSAAAAPAWQAAARANAGGILGCGGINVQQDLAELRSRICHLELKLEQRDGASLAEAHGQAAALKKEFGQLESTLAEALRELGETKNQVSVLQRQIGAGTTTRLQQATEPMAGGSDVNASSTQVTTPSFPRPRAPVIVPPQGITSLRTFPTSPDRESHETQGGVANLWVTPMPRSLPSSRSTESNAGAGSGTASLEWQQQPPFEGGQSTPTQILTPSRLRPPVVQGLSSLRTCLPSPPETVRLTPAPASYMPSPPETVRLPPAPASYMPSPPETVRLPPAPASYMPTLAVATAKACITAGAQVQTSRGSPSNGATVQHIQQQQQQQQYVHQPAKGTGSAPPPGGMHLCHTPVRGGTTCHRLAPGGMHSQGGTGTPIYPAQRVCVRGGA